MKTLIPFLAVLTTSLLGLAVQAENIETHCSSHFETSNPNLNIAVQNMRGLGYPRHAMKEAVKTLVNPRICISGAPLSLDDHLYYKYLLRADVYEGEEIEPRHRFTYFYQDSSTQAHHNIGGKIWVGLDSKDVQDILFGTMLFAGLASREEAETTDVSILAKEHPVYQSLLGEINDETFSILQIYADEKFEGYLVTFMTKLSASNPYRTKPQTKGFVMAVVKAETSDTEGKSTPPMVHYSEEINVQDMVIDPLNQVLNKNAIRYQTEDPALVLLELSNGL